MFLVLTPAQATAVRGPTSPGKALDPVLCADGSYALPAAVLADPAHQVRWAALAGLPQVASITPAVVGVS